MGNQKTDLVIIQGNVNTQRYINLLITNMIPFMLNSGPGTFKHDTAMPHTARITAQFLAQTLQRLVLSCCIPRHEPNRTCMGRTWSESQIKS